FRRTISRESLASPTRPRVAAVAPTAASATTFMLGTVRPTNDKVTHVGGANAGTMLSANTTKKRSTTMVMSSGKSIIALEPLAPGMVGRPRLRVRPQEMVQEGKQ